jgi:hypothetical protein
MGVFALEGTTYKQIDMSIQSASGQVSTDGFSILVATLSLGGPAELDNKKEVYLNIISNAVRHRIWGGGRNTRFGAIILKLSPVTRDVSVRRWRYTTWGSAFMHVIQPGLPLTNNLSISELIDSLSKLPRDYRECTG